MPPRSRDPAPTPNAGPCRQCGSEDWYWNKRKDGSWAAHCRNCRKVRAAKRRKAKPEETLYFGALYRAEQTGSVCTLTVDEVRRMFVLQEHGCAYCGRTLAADRARQTSPSLDQVIPGAGYTTVNTVLACMRCNRRKGDLSPHEMRDMADRVEQVLAKKDAMRQAGAENESEC